MGFKEWWRGEPQTREGETPPPSDPSTVHTVPSRATAPRSVSAREALGLSAVFRAVEIRALAARQISFDVQRGAVIVLDKPALLDKPDPLASPSAFREMTSVSLDLTGNAYWRLGYAPGAVKGVDRPITARVLNPHEVVINHTSAGEVTGYQYRGRPLGLFDVKHLARFRVAGTPYGLGPIQAAQVELRGGLDVVEYGSEFIYSGDVPTGILKSDSVLTKETAAEAKQQWIATRGGKKGVAVLGQGLDYRALYLSPRDAQFIESQQWNVNTVTRLFGVPKSLMLANVEGSSETYQNVEQDWLGFIRFGMTNYLTEAQDAFTELLPRGSKAVYNAGGLLKTDTKTRYETHNLALSGRWRTVNEIREIEGLEPIDGGDALAGRTQGAAA